MRAKCARGNGLVHLHWRPVACDLRAYGGFDRSIPLPLQSTSIGAQHAHGNTHDEKSGASCQVNPAHLMNDRQRDRFLWQWSRRRRIGQRGVAWRALLVGALGGLVFAFVLGSTMSEDGNRSTAWLLQALQRWILLGLLAVPAFAGLAAAVAARVFASHEAMYQDMLRRGASVPERAPEMQPGDRWPAIMVGVAVAILIGLVVALFVAYG